jgi:hypothetical protein
MITQFSMDLKASYLKQNPHIPLYTDSATCLFHPSTVSLFYLSLPVILHSKPFPNSLLALR